MPNGTMVSAVQRFPAGTTIKVAERKLLDSLGISSIGMLTSYTSPLDDENETLAEIELDQNEFVISMIASELSSNTASNTLSMQVSSISSSILTTHSLHKSDHSFLFSATETSLSQNRVSSTKPSRPSSSISSTSIDGPVVVKPPTASSRGNNIEPDSNTLSTTTHLSDVDYQSWSSETFAAPKSAISESSRPSTSVAPDFGPQSTSFLPGTVVKGTVNSISTSLPAVALAPNDSDTTTRLASENVAAQQNSVKGSSVQTPVVASRPSNSEVETGIWAGDDTITLSSRAGVTIGAETQRSSVVIGPSMQGETIMGAQATLASQIMILQPDHSHRISSVSEASQEGEAPSGTSDPSISGVLGRPNHVPHNSAIYISASATISNGSSDHQSSQISAKPISAHSPPSSFSSASMKSALQLILPFCTIFITILFIL